MEIFSEKLKNPVFRQAGMGGRGVRKKGWTWTVCRFKWGIWQKRGGGVFEGGGVKTPMHFIVSRIFKRTPTTCTCILPILSQFELLGRKLKFLYLFTGL